MKKKIYKFVPTVIVISLLFIVINCNNISNNIPKTVSDIDGNIYHTIIIGKQVWMAENLKVTRFRNGDSILNVPGNNQWRELPIPAYCSYDNNDSLGNIYGRLYNWYTVNDSRNLAPQGWHIANDEEWRTLIHYLGGDSIAGDKLKESGPSHWLNAIKDDTNKSGFIALSGGFRSNSDGAFHLIGHNGIWWSNTEHNDSTAWSRMLNSNDTRIYRNYVDKRNGYYVRCVKD